jgi:hypothetical protein
MKKHKTVEKSKSKTALAKKPKNNRSKSEKQSVPSSNKRPNRPKAVAVGQSSDDHTPCHLCKRKFQTREDNKPDEDWLRCDGCNNWFHESCAEHTRVLDDESLVCINCVP